MPAWCYILRLQSGRFYPGATTDLTQRWRDHAAGTACQATALDPPAAMVYREMLDTLSEARRREAQVKRCSGRKKEALVRGDQAGLRRLAVSHDLGCGARPRARSQGGGGIASGGNRRPVRAMQLTRIRLVNGPGKVYN